MDCEEGQHALSRVRRYQAQPSDLYALFHCNRTADSWSSRPTCRSLHALRLSLVDLGSRWLAAADIVVVLFYVLWFSRFARLRQASSREFITLKARTPRGVKKCELKAMSRIPGYVTTCHLRSSYDHLALCQLWCI